MTGDTVHVAMMNLLWPRAGIDRSLFYDYWSGAHTQISSRLPGIHQYFQHHLDHEAGRAFPHSGLFAADHEGFFGDAEITFASASDLIRFADALDPLMQDEQNVFEKTISYQARDANIATLKDATPDDSPNGTLGAQEKYLLYLRRDDHVTRDGFRAELAGIAASLAAEPQVSKVRYRLVDLYDNDAVTLSAPGVSNFEPERSQFDGSLEIVFPDAFARRSYGGTETARHTAELLQAACRDVVVTRALRTYTVYNHGRITLAGLRTPQMADQIARIGAINQVGGQTRDLMLAAHPQIHADLEPASIH